MSPLAWLDRYFEVRARGSTIPTELLAGLSTFMALSYIFVVNPAILSQGGMDKNAVLFATIVASALATLVMGLWARLPFVLAPGMEMNAYVAYFVIGSLGFTWQQALAAVFVSGVLFLILTVSRVRQKIIAAIPDRMKAALSLSVGVFLALVALKIAGILTYDGVHLRGIGSLTSPGAWAFYASLALVLVLDRLRVRGAVLASIILTAIGCHALGAVDEIQAAPAALNASMLSGVGKLDFAVLVNPKIISVILVLFLIDFYGSIAKFIGLTMHTNLTVRGSLPRLNEALLIDGAASVAGSLLGTSTILVYVESGVGIGAGGRTGITAIVCALLMLACFLIAPFLYFVPIIATTGALAYVALKLCPSLSQLRRHNLVDLVANLLMQLAVIVTFAIDVAMLVGFLSYLVKDVLHRRRPNTFMLLSAMLLLLGVALQPR